MGHSRAKSPHTRDRDAERELRRARLSGWRRLLQNDQLAEARKGCAGMYDRK